MRVPTSVTRASGYMLGVLALGACGSSSHGVEMDATPERRDAAVDVLDAVMIPDVRDAGADAPDVWIFFDVQPRDVIVDRPPVADIPPPDGPWTTLVERPRPSCPDTSERGCGVVRVEGGTFNMGGGTQVQSRIVQHDVSISPFALDQSEVTVRRFRRFAEGPAESYRPGNVRFWARGQWWNLPTDTRFSLPIAYDPATAPRATWTPAPASMEDLPIVGVNRPIAMLFCVWDGGFLQTEAQWEWAARGVPDGRPTPRRYAWGNEEDVCARANVFAGARCADREPRLRPVGSFPPTGLFFDLTGNAAELTMDHFRFYGRTEYCWEDQPILDPACLARSPNQCYTSRGGSFATAQDIHTYDRIPVMCEDLLLGLIIDDQTLLTGFRCAYPP